MKILARFFERLRYGELIRQISHNCEKQSIFSAVFPSTYYDTKQKKYFVKFECVEREFDNPSKRSWYYTLRRQEHFACEDFKKLLSFMVDYTAQQGAFLDKPYGKPKDITYSVRVMKRKPNEAPKAWRP